MVNDSVVITFVRELLGGNVSKDLVDVLPNHEC